MSLMHRGVVLVIAAALASAASAATPLDELRVSPDITATLGSPTVEDENVAADNLTGTITAVSIGAIPAETDLDAYARRSNGDQLLSFDTTVELPGGLRALPGDVVRYDGATYGLEFQAAPRGIPGNVNVDAVAVTPSGLLLSFDVTVDFGAFVAEPNDLVLVDATGFSMFFDGSATGVPEGLDLDAADYLICNGHLLVSFDGSGSIGGVNFEDEDALEYDGALWSIAYVGSAADLNWIPADLDAMHGAADLGPGPAVVFGQTVLMQADKVTFHWTNPTAFRAVWGAFSISTGIGSYSVSHSTSGTSNSFMDAAVPDVGAGFWYLVKPGGCIQTSWQSVLGLEPGRDTAIP